MVEEKLVDLTTEVERQHTVCAVVVDVDPVVRLAEVPGHLAAGLDDHRMLARRMIARALPRDAHRPRAGR